MVIDADLVFRLVREQFPAWAGLDIRPVEHGGWDNRTFHLGESMSVRLPSAERYAAQVDKEQRWLPRLAPALPLPIPVPIGRGEPGEGYPWPWSIYRWLPGESAVTAPPDDLTDFATSLGGFLRALQRVDASGGPSAGDHSFFRGGDLATYDAQTRQCVETLADSVDLDAVLSLWEDALASRWTASPVWVHGDVSAGNLLVRNGRLSAVIDFGCCAVGDPACDLAIAWTFLDGPARRAFRDMLAPDPDTWTRGRGWTLWKALVEIRRLEAGTSGSAGFWRNVLDGVLADTAHTGSE